MSGCLPSPRVGVDGEGESETRDGDDKANEDVVEEVAIVDGSQDNRAHLHDPNVDYALGPNEFCMVVENVYYVFDREVWDTYIRPADTDYWREFNPRYKEQFCFAYSLKQRCVDPECKCRYGEKCKHVGMKLTCDVPGCSNPKHHDKWACFEKHPEITPGKRGTFNAAKKFFKRPRSREPSRDRNGRNKSPAGRRDF